MRFLLFALLGLAFSTTAIAADLPSYKDPSRTAIGGLLPTGFYANAGLGEAFSSAGVEGLALSAKGVTLDGRIGYDMLLGGSKFVAGPFVGAGIQDVTGKTLSPNQHWSWEIGGRFGRVFNTSDLLYVLAAYEQQHIEFGDTGFKPVLDGFKTGGGIEFDVTTGVTVGTELSYTWFNTVSPVEGVKIDTAGASGTVRLGFRL